jgi:CBS domain-containing protein
MNVEQIMSRDVAVCGPEDNLESVAITMWNRNCGAIPIIDSSGKPCGMITDRDVAMASALRHKPLWDIKTREVSNERIYTCSPDEDVNQALDVMRGQKIRRLAVVDGNGRIQGILSIDDVIQHFGENGLRKLMPTIKEVCQPHPH